MNWTRYIEEIFDGTENEHLDLKNPSNVQIVIYEMGFIRDIIKFIHERNIEEIRKLKTIEMRVDMNFKFNSFGFLEFGLWWKIVSTLLPYADFDIFQEKIKTFSEISQYEQFDEKICRYHYKDL